LPDVELEVRHRRAAWDNRPKWTGQRAQLTADAQTLIQLDGLVVTGDGFYRAYRRAGGFFAMAALDRHHAGPGMGDIQARVSLQTGFAMVLNATGDAGITCNTTSGISNYKVVHGALFPPSIESL
jgi:hypothetical protein